MEITDNEAKLILGFIEYVWQNGGIRNPAGAVATINLQARLQIETRPKEPEKAATASNT